MIRHSLEDRSHGYPLAKKHILFVGASSQEISSPKKMHLPHGLPSPSPSRGFQGSSTNSPARPPSSVLHQSSLSVLPSRPEGAYDFVVAVDGGANWCRKYNAKPDAFIGDSDTLQANTKRWIKRIVPETILYSSHKDDTDFSLALSTFLPRFMGQPCVVDCIGVLAGKLEHQLGVVGVLQRACTRYSTCCFTLRGVSQTVQVLSHPGNACAEIVKEHLASVGETFSLIPLTRCVVSECGCEWNLQRKLLQPLADRGISNKVKTKGARIYVHRGVVLAMFPNR